MHDDPRDRSMVKPYRPGTVEVTKAHRSGVTAGPAAFRVLVCGGRHFYGWPAVSDALWSLHHDRRITCIIHGGATGADALSERWAAQLGIRAEKFTPDWRKHGRAAGPLRNARMLAEGRPDVVVAFIGGRGTADMCRQAEAAGIEVRRVGWE